MLNCRRSTLFRGVSSSSSTSTQQPLLSDSCSVSAASLFSLNDYNNHNHNNQNIYRTVVGFLYLVLYTYTCLLQIWHSKRFNYDYNPLLTVVTHLVPHFYSSSHRLSAALSGVVAKCMVLDNVCSFERNLYKMGSLLNSITFTFTRARHVKKSPKLARERCCCCLHKYVYSICTCTSLSVLRTVSLSIYNII